MKNLANYISISRILMSIVLIATKPFSIIFYVIYIYCGLSDMLDGYIARKNNDSTMIGSLLDSIADITFVIISIIKIVPLLNLHNAIIIWGIIIALIKVLNAISSYIYYKKIIFLHTIANKITGLVLFIAPLILVKNNYLSLEVIICTIAIISAIQEGHYIRTQNYN